MILGSLRDVAVPARDVLEKEKDALEFRDKMT